MQGVFVHRHTCYRAGALPQVVFRIFKSTFQKVGFDIFKPKLFLKERDDGGVVNAILAGVYVCREKTTLGKRMNANMALCDNDKPAPTPGVFAMVLRRRNDKRIGERTHTKRSAQFS